MFIGSPSIDEGSELIILYLKKYPNDFNDDSKKMRSLAELLENLSPSDIKNLCSTAIKNNLVNNRELLSYPEFLYEIFCLREDKDYSIEKAVKFLSVNGVTQMTTHQLLELPIRKVRNILSD